MTIHADIRKYNASQPALAQKICTLLAKEISHALPDGENKVWHAHPVWFLDGNPVAGYSTLRDSVRLLFWSGQSFRTPGLEAAGSFKAAEASYTSADQVDAMTLRKWLAESRNIQWDYQNIARRKGRLERLK